ncbi:MAG: hypothetical protein AB7K09_21685 [Planctomycetota bacterium]
MDEVNLVQPQHPTAGRVFAAFGLAGLFAVMCVVACSSNTPPPSPANTTNHDSANTPQTHLAERMDGDARGLPNLFRLADNLYSGAQPEGAIAFESLKALGVKTIVTVDGAIPDVDGAAAVGIRYVHLPIGYDGIDAARQREIIRAVQVAQADGPVYVHCHHGKHRGVTAAAICAMGLDGYTHDEALEYMTKAGTGANYLGLWRAAREFEAPAQSVLDALPTEFPSKATTRGMVKTMNAIDERWEHLGRVHDAGFVTPADHPDIDPPHEALQLMELFRELGRTDDDAKAHGEDFLARLTAAEHAADALGNALTAFAADKADAAKKAAAEAAHQAVGAACKSCHAAYRDNR